MLHERVTAAADVAEWAPRPPTLSSLCGGRISHPGTRRKLGGGAIGAAYELRLESVILVGTARLPSLAGLFFERGAAVLGRQACASCAAVVVSRGVATTLHPVPRRVFTLLVVVQFSIFGGM